MRVLGFRGHRTYAWIHALHAAAGLRGGLAALAALASLELEGSGRASWMRRVLPAGEGANVAARIPAAGDGAAHTTLVLVSHHDAARTGVSWRLLRPRGLRAQSMGAFLAPVAAGLTLAALPWRAARTAGRALLALAIAADLDIARSPTVPGASDNASGVAAVLALAEHWLAAPLQGVEVWAVSCGGEESGMDGMRAFLAAHDLDRASTFVLGLDTLGGGTPIVVRAEGVLLAHRYDERDLALVDRGAAVAGEPPPDRWRLGGWTDPVLARFAGLRTACLLSVGPDGAFTHYHLPSDTPEHVDHASVRRCVAIARGVGEALAAAP